MKVIIPLAGLGTRLLPHTRRRQKCLLPVAGKPVLDHIIDPLVAQDFDEIVFVTVILKINLENTLTNLMLSLPSFARKKR